MDKRIKEANDFRNSILKMNGMSVRTFPEATELFTFFRGSKDMLPVYSMEDFVRRSENLAFLMYDEFRIMFKYDPVRNVVIVKDLMKFLPRMLGDDWRVICATEQRNKELLAFGHSDIDIKSWVPDGWNY